ncbi:MAG TPA: hypothetical protein VK735_20960 [Pseudonocardia sp.]|uniref:hypothetical protein n=1 Tax=Pseudonocardia sp. TaxID=60912 RepID=UPI002C7596D0|nr:hypothetical protein [Pseudonocardia sp.]HTF49920.1 hypothetical protein [Pseudonocardia sp.]
MTGLLIVVGLIALAVLAPRYGADLRDGSDWRYQRDQTLAGGGPRHTPRSDLAALHRWMSWVGGLLARRWDAQERAWDAAWRAHQPWRGDEPPARLGDQTEPPRPGDRAEPPARQDDRAEPSVRLGDMPRQRGVTASEPGAGERGRHRDELCWRAEGGSWRLEGQLLPPNPAAGDQNEHPAHLD